MKLRGATHHKKNNMVKSVKKMCVKCNQTPMQLNKKHADCCGKCSSAVRKMCVKCNQTPMQVNKKHAGCCRKYLSALMQHSQSVRCA